jgi:hypothetical protein
MKPLQAVYGGGVYDAFVSEVPKAQPNVTLSPTSLDFGNGTVGHPNGPRKVTLTNSGQLTLTINSIHVTGANSGDFAQTNNCGSSLSAGASCSIEVTFTAAAIGARSAALSVADNATNSPQLVKLSGTGVLPSVTFTPPSLTFPNQLVFTTSSSQTVVLSNTGLGILNITGKSIAGQFSETDNCGAFISAGNNCSFTVTFKPTTKGTLTGAITITDNAPDSPQTVSLTGVGTFMQINPTTENFGIQPVGTTSVARQVIVTNQGHSTVSISSIAITGTNAGDFAETNTCGTSLASGASCKIVVTFTPAAKGKRTANVAITDNGGGSPQMVSLSGTGT